MLAGLHACNGMLDPFLGCCTTGEVAKHLGPYSSESSSRRSMTPLRGDVPLRPGYLLTLNTVRREIV
jgi:hypothetical protein